MKKPTRASVMLAALGLLLAVPATAGARPVSTHVIRASMVQGTETLTLVVEVTESGDTAAVVDAIQYAVVSCDGGLAARTTIHTANGDASTASFAVDRKLTDVAWQGVVEVATTVTDSCAGTTVTTTDMWNVTLAGSSSNRLSRTRSDGNRILMNVVSYEGSTPSPVLQSFSD